ncbi:C40 family peptidase [Anaeromicropila herbilytica]|uniref:NlpC/P60 domain-containing protein n=1 Tax=Anaeromicropila herbilytica TaxID=2785025 RepID=A0A7R7EHN6_9FIRM|nr:C40 family peptidase [Anaeromicropila herbilytica]BCN28920.1 hypothetical protein bsdtb5_02150 [Anaeromicropila herbilytica]
MKVSMYRIMALCVIGLFLSISNIAVSSAHTKVNASASVTVSESTSGSTSNRRVALADKKTELRKKIVRYALQFRGNPYVWGGTSLTRGADCSGFTQSVFRDNGIRIQRTSRTQATGGKVISESKLRPGDLIFYARSGRINHVGIYIGKGKVISASSARTGIRVTYYKYRKPVKMVSYVG